MVRDKDKMKDVSRASLFPSRRRARSARYDFDLIRRGERRRSKKELHALEDFDEFDPAFADRETKRSYGHAIGDRRANEHINPALRWGEKMLKGKEDLTDEAKYYLLKSHLPDTLAGRHALSHVYFPLVLKQEYSPRARHDHEDRVELMAIAIFDKLAELGHKRFNAQLKTLKSRIYHRDIRDPIDCKVCHAMVLYDTKDETIYDMAREVIRLRFNREHSTFYDYFNKG